MRELLIGIGLTVLIMTFVVYAGAWIVKVVGITY
jgi:hypothetical protein